MATDKRWVEYRDAGKEWAKLVEDEDDFTDDEIRTGALLRIADALDRAHPPQPNDYSEEVEREYRSRVRAYEVYLAAKGLDSDNYRGDWELSEELNDALDSPDRCPESAAELCACPSWWYGVYCDADEGHVAELRAAMKARGLYFDDEWPD